MSPSTTAAFTILPAVDLVMPNRFAICLIGRYAALVQQLEIVYLE